MDKFKMNSPEPEFKPMTTADVQEEYGHIPVLCQNISNLEEFFNTTDEEARWIINTTLTAAKVDLTSMTELIGRLIKENQVLSQQSQSAQSESKHLRQELDAERERNVQLQKIICNLTPSEIQLKTDLLHVFQSSDRRIAVLEEEIAQMKRTAQQSSTIAGYDKNRRPMRTQPEKQLTGIFRDFVIISKDVVRTEFGSKLILTNILNRDYGRVVGHGGQNAERLQQEYGVKINVFDRHQENLKLIISEGDANSRLAASDDIIENLPVVVECPNLDTNGQALKNATFHCDVTINRTNLNNPGVTICGRLTNCRQAYKLLVNDDNIWYPK